MDNNLELTAAVEEETNVFKKVMKKLFGGKKSLEKRKAMAGYAFVLPFLIGIVLIYVPLLIDSVWLSFKLDDSVQTFVGFQNYIDSFKNPDFTNLLLSGLQQLLLEVPAIIVFSLFIAVVLNQKMLGRAAFRAIFFLPVIISTGIMVTINASDTLSSAAGSGITDGSEAGGNTSGASEIISILDVQTLFESMGIPALTELITYVVNIVNNIFNIINYSGVQMLIFLAGLQSISPSIYEACQIEGATGWETFWKITFPMISPMILVNSVYTVIDSFTRNTNPVMADILRNISQGRFGLATARAWVYFLIVALILAAIAGIVSSFVFYQRKD